MKNNRGATLPCEFFKFVSVAKNLPPGQKKRNIACGNVSEKEGLCFLHFTFDSNKVSAIKSTAVIIKTKWHWMNLYSD